MDASDTAAADIGWLSAFPALLEVGDPAWLDAARAARPMSMPAGTVVIREGDPCQHFLLVVEGTVRVYKAADNGREILLYRTCGGDICVLTLSNLLEGTAYSAEAVTEDTVRVISIPQQHFRRAMAESEAFRTAILGTLARRLNDLMCLVEQVSFQSLDLRLACLLGQLFGERASRRLHMTHQELASELGTTREVVSRLLKSFERRGCIRLHRGCIELLSAEVLEHVARTKSV